MFQQDRRFAVFIEPRFLIGPGGLMDYVVNQNVDRAQFVDHVIERFLPRMVKMLERFDVLPNAGSVYTPEVVREVAEVAGAASSHRRDEFGRLFTYELLGRIHAWTGTDEIVCKEPHAILWAGYLSTIFPTAKFIHVIRDPRDVCASVVKRHWGPPNVLAFPDWYNRLMEEAWAAKMTVPEGHYVTVSLDRMVDNPPATFGQLCARLRERKATGDILGKLWDLVTPGDCHRGRFAEDLGLGEAGYVHDYCWRWYKRWLDLSIV
jgi:hypothetical protein